MTLRERIVQRKHAAGRHEDCLPTAECQQRPAWVRLAEARELRAKELRA